HDLQTISNFPTPEALTSRIMSAIIPNHRLEMQGELNQLYFWGVTPVTGRVRLAWRPALPLC
ncbi:MAG: hypothetical protein WA744_22240, partial [Candidatus Acidiferrales bacterium]